MEADRRIEDFVRKNGKLYKRNNADVIRLELDTDHYYWLDKVGWVPSVTSILDEAAPVNYGLRQFWKQNSAEESNEIFKTAGEFGTMVHNALEQLLNGEELDLLNDYPERRAKRSIMKFADWFNLVKPVDFMSEQVVASTQYQFAGTLDFLGKIRRQDAAIALGLNISQTAAFVGNKPDQLETWLIDFKTTKQLSYNHELQVAAYKQGVLEGFGITVDHMGLLRVGSQHKAGYEFRETFRSINDYMHVYRTYLNLHNGKIPQPEELVAYPHKFRLLKEVKK